MPTVMVRVSFFTGCLGLLAGVAPAAAEEVAASSAPAAVAASQPRHGLTLEAGFGTGWLQNEDYGEVGELSSLLGSASLGAGTWLTPQLALGGRAVVAMGENSRIDLGMIFVGPSVQKWFGEHLWVGGAAGAVLLYGDRKPQSGVEDLGVGGASLGGGVELRAGYAVSLDRFAVAHASLVALPSYLEGNVATTMSLMLGLQML